jgi:transposase
MNGLRIRRRFWTKGDVLFVLYTGITWQQLPLELGFGSGQTCWRRLQKTHT